MSTDSDVLEKRLAVVLRHKQDVLDDCTLLGQRLIEHGDDLGRELISNGFAHDNSKLSGIEWLYLHPDIKESNPELFKAAHIQHITTNRHHPEAWDGGIHSMPRVFIAEMACDWHARSSVFGTDLWEWIKEDAIPKYKLSTCGKTYKQLKDFLELLLDRKFK